MTIVHPPMSYDLHKMMKLVSGERGIKGLRKKMFYFMPSLHYVRKNFTYSKIFIYLSF